MNNIIALLQAGYEVRLSKKSIQIIEIYKSESREKWTEKEVGGSFGSFDYWSEGAIHIIASNIEKYKNDLLQIKEDK